MLEGEKTLKLLFSVHVQGGVAFQQSSDSPHIAQECDHGLETRVCFCEEVPHDSLDTRERGFTPFSTEENKGVCNDGLDHHGDGGPSLSCETATALLHNGNSEDKRACACENSETDCRAQEESSTAGVVSTGDIGDSSDGLQSNSVNIEAYRTSSCGQQKEEADKADDLICEAPGESQEKGHNSVEEKALEEKELSELNPTAEAGDMGITQSLDTPESSDVESCSQGAETDDEEDDGFREPIEPVEVQEESKELLEVNPDGDAPLDCLNQDWIENEMRVCRDVRDKTGDPGTYKLEGSEVGVCENIRCNLEDNQDHVDSSRTSDQEDANEEFQNTLEMPYLETHADQQKEELSDTTSRTSIAEHASVSCLHEINRELLPVENPILSFIEDAVEEGSEVDGQRLLSSFDISQTEPGPEPGSPTGASEDTLEPEVLEVILGTCCEEMENVQENQENKPIFEAQATLEEVLESEIPADMEKVNLPDDSSQDPRQDMTSNNEVTQGTSEIESSEGNAGIVFVNTNTSGDLGVLVDPSDIPVLFQSNESGISEENLAVNTEDLMSGLIHSDHVDGALHVSKALVSSVCHKNDIIDSSVCPEQAQENLDPMSQDAESAVHEVGQTVGEEDLLKGELNAKHLIYL